MSEQQKKTPLVRMASFLRHRGSKGGGRIDSEKFKVPVFVRDIDKNVPKMHEMMLLKHAITIRNFAILYSNTERDRKILCFLHNYYIIATIILGIVWTAGKDKSKMQTAEKIKRTT